MGKSGLGGARELSLHHGLSETPQSRILPLGRAQPKIPRDHRHGKVPPTRTRSDGRICTIPRGPKTDSRRRAVGRRLGQRWPARRGLPRNRVVESGNPEARMARTGSVADRYVPWELRRYRRSRRGLAGDLQGWVAGFDRDPNLGRTRIRSGRLGRRATDEFTDECSFGRPEWSRTGRERRRRAWDPGWRMLLVHGSRLCGSARRRQRRPRLQRRQGPQSELRAGL